MARVIVKSTTWVVAHDSYMEEIVESFWVESTAKGSVGILADVADMNQNGSGNFYAIFQWHVWYADGGHGKYNTREFKIVEADCGAPQPDLAPVPLVPTPEA